MKFESAKISTVTYNTSDYKAKEYSTLSGFKKGLKANQCPFEVDENGLFSDYPEGKLKKRSWSVGSKKFTATVN